GDRAASSGQDVALLSGLRASSRLVEAVGPDRVHLVERSEAPVLELDGDWEEVYRAKTTGKRRNQNARKRGQLAAAARLETEVAREPDELAAALEDAFAVHEVRWRGRPDGSGFATPAGRQFHRAALRRLAELGIPRIVALRLDGRPLAFHYFFLFERRLSVHRLAFDPAYARHSPGPLDTPDAIEAAAADGATIVEFLGGAERSTSAL